MRPTLLSLSIGLLAGHGLTQCVIHDFVSGSTGTWPFEMTPAFGKEVYFRASVSPYGAELFRWTAGGGVQLVADIGTGGNGSTPQQLTPCCSRFGPRVFFSASSLGSGYELWMTDGTSAGTTMVKEINPGIGSSNVADMIAVRDRVFFAASDGSTGIELWVSDGTAAGTTQVSDINLGVLSSTPEPLASLNGLVYFTAWTPQGGRDLWITDGTFGGTSLVWPGSVGSNITRMVECNGRLYYSASDPTRGRELWTTDGTPAGTHVVADLSPNSGSSDPQYLTCFGDLLYFVATTPTEGRELWKTDGTAAGTTIVADLVAGSLPSTPRDLTVSDGRIFFSAEDFATGRELYVSDGTAAGTTRVTDLVAGFGSSFPQDFVASGSGVCFYASDSNGAEPWFSDGTATNTFRICDINPGSGSSTPQQFTVSNGRVFFQANDPAFGNELFEVATPGAVMQVLGVGGLPSEPTLRSRNAAAPVLGVTIDLDSVGPTGALGILVGGPAVLPAAPFPGLTIGGCDWASVGGGGGIVLATSPQSTFSFALTLPAQPWLVGVGFHLQTFWFTPAATPPLEPSNGLQLVLGGPLAS
ncbi:MAG: hypothetical protein NXI31_17520 [bacterium]|nr:hypothetical protein [bacterium]